LLFAIYWFPDVILAYPEVYLKSLVGYEREVVATWIFLGNTSLSLFLGILVCYKLGYYKNTLSFFKLKNILFLLLGICAILLVQFIAKTYYDSHFMEPGIAKLQAAFSNQLAYPFAQFISFGVCAPIFEEAAFRTTFYRFFKNDKIAFWVSSIGFAWMHTGPNPILIVYLPISILLTLIYHRRKVLAESIIVHGVTNVLIPIAFTFLQTHTGIYYL
jgi:CAAX amino terminal protease family.